MRIGHLAAGIWRTVHLEMATALARLGNPVIVYTEDERAPTSRSFTRFDEGGVTILAIHHEKRNPWLWALDRAAKPWLGRRFFTSLAAIACFIRRTRCDIYLVEGEGLGVFLALLSRVMKFRWVICVHDPEYLGVRLGYPGEPSDRVREARKRRVLAGADGIRANSQVTRDALVAAGFDAEAITVIPLHHTARMRIAGDIAAFRAESRAQVRARHALPADCTLLVSMCRLTPIKGIDLALEALALALRVRPGLRLLVCGGDRVADGASHRASLERLAERLGVRGAVVFTGNIEVAEVKRYYAAADLHLVSSWIESFNYSAVEAALAGTRSVITRRVGSGPWLARCGAASVVEPRSAEAYAAALLGALEHTPDAVAAAEIARRVERELAVEPLAREVEQMLIRHAA